LETRPASQKDASEANVQPIEPARQAGSRDKRAWTIKGIASDTVTQARRAAQTQGMLLSLWVDKQLRDAAERELAGGDIKSFAADIMCTKIESIEAALKDYLQQQDRRIAELQKEVHRLSTKIVPPLLKVLSEPGGRRKKRA
jgi:hypothetical protein